MKIFIWKCFQISHFIYIEIFYPGSSGQMCEKRHGRFGSKLEEERLEADFVGDQEQSLALIHVKYGKIDAEAEA